MAKPKNSFSALNNLPLNSILRGDCRDILARWPAASVDMIFADPPYFLQLNQDLKRPDDSPVDGVKEEWDRFDSFADYDTFSRQWLSACRHVLKDSGSLWVIGSYHNIFRLGTILQDLGFWILNDIVWIKSNPMPNFRGTRFTNAHETMIWCTKSKNSACQFNYRAMKTLNDDLQMRSDWYLPLCGGGERLRDATGKKIHPTQKPEALLYRVVTASTKPGDLVLDPFSGTGTTLAVAKKLGRDFVGIERDERYIDHSRKRLEAIQKADTESGLYTAETPRKQARIPFGALIENGFLQPGDLLESQCRRWQAKIHADARISVGNQCGSIHQISAALQGRESCNGWTFWSLCPSRKKPARIPLDELRKKLRMGEKSQSRQKPSQWIKQPPAPSPSSSLGPSPGPRPDTGGRASGRI